MLKLPLSRCVLFFATGWRVIVGSMLRDAAMYWVRKNCKDPRLQSDFADKLDSCLRGRMDCWFAVGGALTRHRVPYVLHCFAGELFAFQINDQQAAALLLKPNALITSTDPRPAPPNNRVAMPMISILRLKLDRETVAWNQPISGSCEYEVTGESPSSYCLRMDFSLFIAGDEIRWHFPDQILLPRGQMRFCFSELGERLMPDPNPGLKQVPLALFLRACVNPPSGEAESRDPISNTCGVLVDFVTR